MLQDLELWCSLPEIKIQRNLFRNSFNTWVHLCRALTASDSGTVEVSATLFRTDNPLLLLLRFSRTEIKNPLHRIEKWKALCTEQKMDFSLLPYSHTHFQIDKDGHSEGSFMGRERTSFTKAVILHLSIKVGDSRPFLNPLQELREKRFCCQHVRLFIWVI